MSAQERQGTVTPQRRGKNSSGPRALGLVVFAEDAGTPAAGATKKKPQLPRLIPVTLWYEQRFFDAEAYKAAPAPMALETDIVYEVQQTGDPVGLFTVGGSAQLNGIWLAEGRYTTNAELEARAKRNKAAAIVVQTDERPKLRRASPGSGSGSGDSTTAPAKTEPTASRDGDAPPRLTHPAESQPPPTPSASAADTKAASASTTSTPPPAKPPEEAPSPDSDPNRPKLQRGAVPQTIAPKVVAPKSQPQPATPASAAVAAATTPGNSPAPIGPQLAVPPSKAPKVMVAISDSAGPESRPYIFHWSAEEQGRLTTAALQIANEEILKFGAVHYGLRATPSPAAAAPASRTRGRAPAQAKPAPPPSPLDEMQVRAFDLDLSNYPVIVLSGHRTIHDDKASPGTADRTYYVALVLWADMRMSGSAEQYRRLLVSVTDDQHLDQIPRLQLVDVVDADGDGIGDLLFRGTRSLADEADPSTWSFQLYRTGPDKLRKVYDSAGESE